MNPIAIFNKEIRITLREDRVDLLICLAIAAFFWFLVKLSQEYETHWKFQVHYVLPEKEAFTRRPPDLVGAKIGGTGWNLMYHSVFRKKAPVVFDLTILPTSLIDRRLLIDRIQGSLAEDKLSVKDVDLDFIPLEVEPRSTRKVPVSLAYELRIQPHHDLKSPYRLTPDSVQLSGPASLVDGFSHWPTIAGQTGPLKSDFSLVIPLSKDKTGVLELDAAQTRLDAEIEAVVGKTIFYVPVAVTHAPDSIRIFPGSVTVYCVVGMSSYNQLDASDFIIEADLKNIVRNSAQNTIPLNLTCSPDFAKNVRFSPQSVEFFFEVGR